MRNVNICRSCFWFEGCSESRLPHHTTARISHSRRRGENADLFAQWGKRSLGMQFVRSGRANPVVAQIHVTAIKKMRWRKVNLSGTWISQHWHTIPVCSLCIYLLLSMNYCRLIFILFIVLLCVMFPLQNWDYFGYHFEEHRGGSISFFTFWLTCDFAIYLGGRDLEGNVTCQIYLSKHWGTNNFFSEAL